MLRRRPLLAPDDIHLTKEFTTVNVKPDVSNSATRRLLPYRDVQSIRFVNWRNQRVYELPLAASSEKFSNVEQVLPYRDQFFLNMGGGLFTV